MQTSRFLLLLSVALCALPVRGADADAQKKAREALEQKLDTAETPPPAAAPQTPAPIATPQPPPTAPTPQAAPPAVVPQAAPPAVVPQALPPAAAAAIVAAPAVAAKQMDPEATAKAREAVRQKVREIESQPSATAATAPLAATPPTPSPVAATQPPPAIAAVQPPPPAVVAPAAAAAAAAAAATPPAVQPVLSAATQTPPGVDSESIIKAREAMRQRMQEILSHTPPDQPHVIEPYQPINPPAQLPPPPPAKPHKLEEAFPPLASPALPISADKDARLKELLSRYQADQITPEEYHAARAKILAEP